MCKRLTLNLTLVAFGLVACFAAVAQGQKTTATEKTSEATAKKTPDSIDEDVLMVPQPVKELWLKLPPKLLTASKEPAVKIRLVPGTKSWVLPVYLSQNVVLHREEADKRATRVIVTILDAFNDPELSAGIEEAVDTRLNKATWDRAEPQNGKVEVTLWIDENGEHRKLGSTRFTRSAGATKHVLDFQINHANTLKLVTDTVENQGAVLSKLGLTFRENYLVQYAVTDLSLSLRTTQQTAVDFENLVAPDQQGRKPALFVAFGGNVKSNLAIRQLFQRRVEMQILQRQGAEINPTLVDNLVGKLFAGLEKEVDLAKLKDDTVVTFMFGNGFKITQSIGEFKAIKDQIKTEVERRQKNSSADSGKTRDKTKNVTDGKASVLAGLFSSDYREEEEEEHEKEWAVSRSAESETKDASDLVRALDGTLPVVALGAEQMQKLKSNSETVWDVELKNFRRGTKGFSSPVSFQQFVGTVEAKKANENAEIRDLNALVRSLKASHSGQADDLDKALKEIESLKGKPTVKYRVIDVWVRHHSQRGDGVPLREDRVTSHSLEQAFGKRVVAVEIYFPDHYTNEPNLRRLGYLSASPAGNKVTIGGSAATDFQSTKFRCLVVYEE